MRILLDHELLTMKEAQRLLQVNRCTINEMIRSKKLGAIKIGSQWKIEGRSLKQLLLTINKQDVFEDKFFVNASFIKASDYETKMIADWT